MSDMAAGAALPATELLYFLDGATSGEATIVAVGEDGGRHYVVLDRTLFHPGGGGQKSDLGTIAGVPMVKAEKRGDVVFHFLAAALSAPVGDVVALEVDPALRLLHAQWHTAGHLVGSVLEEVFDCTAVSGQHWPGDAFMRFDRASEPTPEESARGTAMLAAVIAEDRPITIELQGPTRFVTIAGFPAVPCGGTHLSGTRALGAVEIVSVRVKKEHLMVGYRVPPAGAA